MKNHYFINHFENSVSTPQPLFKTLLTACCLFFSQRLLFLGSFKKVLFRFFLRSAISKILLIALLMCGMNAWGQSAGFNNTFIVLSLNGGANAYYDLNAATANTDFNGASLGTFAAGSSNLILKGAEHNVYKCNGADLTSTRLYYRIYLTASPSGSYTSQSIGFTSGGANGCGGQDQVWSNTGLTTNLLTGLGAGAYTIEVYSDATITCCGGTAFASNSGNNYKATFTVSSIEWTNSAASTAWYTNTNWTPNTSSGQWLAGSHAVFQNAGTATTSGININTAALSIGAIDVTSSRTRALTIGNSSATAGNLTLNGVALSGNANVILRNSSSSLLTLQDNETGTGKTMNVALGNATTNVIDAAGSGGITISSVISGASRSITKIGTSGTLTLSNTGNTYSGGTIISGGTVSASAAGNLGDATGAITLGSGATSATLAATGSFTRNVVNITTSSSAGVIDVASSQTLTVGALNTVSGTDNTTKIGKSGAGTLTLSGAGSYVGQTQIGQGTVIVSNNAGLGTNNSTSARGIDLGLNVGDVSQANNVSVLATNGITVPQSIYVAPNTTSATRTIGTSGTTASATFSNEIFLDGSATLAPVSGGTLTMSGNIINTGGLTTTTGTTLLSGTNTYSGTTTVSSGTLRLGSTSALGSTAAGTSITSGAVLDLNGINYSSAEALTVNGTGISSGGAIINGSSTGATYAGLLTLGSNSSIIGGTGTIAISNTGTITGSTFGLTLGGAQGGSLASVIGTGTGTLTKQDAGTWTLTNSSHTFTGTTTITAGELRLNPSANASYASQIVLNGGTLSTTGITATRTWTSTSTINVSANSTIALASGTSHTLTFAASNAISWTSGTSIMVTGWSGGYNGGVGTGGRIFVGTTSTGLTADQLSRIFFFNGTNYYTATQRSDGEVVATATIINWFSLSAGSNPLTLTNWTSAPNGTGTNPTVFSTSSNTFLIQSGHTYTANADWTVAGTLNVQGTFTLNTGSTARALSVGNLISGGSITIDGSAAGAVASSITVTGDFTQTAGTLDMNARATNSGIVSVMNIAGNFSQSSGATITESGGNSGSLVFNKSSGTQTYTQNGTISNTVRATKNAAGTLSLNSDVSWPSNVTVSSGTLDFGSTARTMTLSTGSGSINFSGGTVLMNGGNVAHKIIVTGTNPIITFPTTWTHGTGDIFEFNQSGTTTNIDQNVTFNHLTITSGTTRIGTTAGPYTATVGGDLTINGGTLTISESGDSHILSVTGNATVNSGGTLNTCNTNSFNSTLNLYGNLSVNGTGALNKTSGALTSTINFLKSSGTQSVSLATNASFAHAWVVGNGSTTNTVQVGANWGIGASSSLSIESGSTLDIQTYTITGTSATFNAKSGSTIITQNASGLSTTASTGAVQVTGAKTYNTGASYTYNGSLAQVTGNGVTGANNLTINNSAGVTLSGPISLSGTLTLTSGQLVTTSTNLLTITNTAAGSVSGGSTTAFISGPVKRSIGTGTYAFPVGKSSTYYPFTIVTSASSSPVVTLEAFASNAGGSLGSQVSALSTTEYWSATLNSGTLTGAVSLTRQATLSTLDAIAQSSTVNGSYSSIGGGVSGTSINTSNSISSLGFFVMATGAACAVPSSQASGVTFSSVTDAGMTINWSGSGNGDGVIVVMKAGSAPSDPIDNTAYTASTTFGSGTDVGSSSFVVVNGSASSVTVTGLTASTTYHVKVYSKNCSGSSTKINTTSPPSGSQITLATELAAHPASFTSAATVGAQIDLTYSAANTITNAAGYIILQKSGASAPSSTPTDATSYSIGGTIGDGTVADIVTDITQTTSAITGLASSTQYSYSIIPFSFDGSNTGTYNYYTAATIRTTSATTIAAVSRYAVANGNWNATSTWSASSGGASGASVPTGSDVVYIQGGYTVTVTANASCGTINFDDAGTLSVNSNVTLAGGAINLVQGNKTVSGTIAGAGTITCTTVNIGTGTPSLTATRTTTLTSTITALTASAGTTLTARDNSGFRNNPTFNLQSGTFTTTGITTSNQTSSCTSTFTMATGDQTGTLKLTGATPFTISANATSTITLNGTSATVEYSGAAQTVRNTSYTNLTLSGSGNKTLAAFSISGTLSIQGTAAAITTAPTFGASSTLEYKNAGNRTTTAIEWPSSSGPSNLIIDNSGSTITMLSSANRTLSGNLTLTAGTLADAGNTLTVQGNIEGTATHSGAGSITMTGTTKTISGATLQNLTLNGSGFSLTGSPTINGALTFTSGKLSIGSNTLNLAGTVASMNATNSITGSSSSNLNITGTGALGTLFFDATTAGTTNRIVDFTLNRTSTGSATLGSAITISGNLTLTNGTLTTGANTLTYSGSSISRTNGNIDASNASGVVAFTNTSSLTLPSSLFSGTVSTFTVNGSGGVTLGGNTTMGTLNLTSGTLTVGSANTVTINSGGAVSRTSGALASSTGAGKFSFSGTGTVSGTVGFNDVDIAGGVDFGTASTINGTLTINSGGFVSNNKPPIYGSSSKLYYFTTGTFGRGAEWSASSGTVGTTAGYPNDVQIGNNTTINHPNTGNSGADAFSTTFTVGRDLTIDAGSSFYMDWGGSGNKSGGLNVLRNISVAGNLSLGNAVGGDLNVGGNWTHTTGSFQDNGRAVTFNGATGDQTITNASGETFSFLTINKATSGGVTLGGPVTVSNTLTLTKGIVTTTSSNLLHITNTSAAAMSGGNSTSYVSGPLRWSVSNGSGGDYKFHLGKSSTYLPLNVNNPTGTSPVLTAEAFASNSGGSAGSGLVSLSTAEYWSVVNTGTLSSATISLAKSSIGSNDGIGTSTTLAGTYTNLGGSATNTLISGNTVTAGSTVGSMASTTYFVLATKVAAPTITSFTPSSGHVGTSITITGTNFTNASAVTIGGVAAASYTVNSATSISATVAAGGATGTISVTTPGGTATSSSSFTFNGYISTQNGDWGTTSTWLGGAVPPASSTVTIDHAVTVNSSVTNAPSSVTINSTKSLTFGASGALTATTVTNNGSIVMTSGGTLTIASGGTLANGTSTFTRGSGTVAFDGTGTVTGTIGFNNVTLAGGVNFGTASTINGTMSINSGGFVNTNPPTYASGSTLRYNSGGTYGRGTEWSATSGAGYPHHVQISNSTTFSLGANSGTGTARQLAGNLTVDASSTLTMNATSEVMTQALTVKGNYINNGTTILSSSIGGDLALEGDLTDNNVFTANGRAIFFRGGNTQSITSNTDPLDIDVARVEKSGGEIVLLQNLLVDETADPIQFAGTSSILNLNGKTATFGKAGTASTISMNSTSAIKGSSTSSLTILGTGAAGTIRFDQTTLGTTNVLQNLTINRTSTGSVTLGNSLTVGGTLALTDGSLVVGANTLTYSGSSITRTGGAIDASNASATIAFTNASALTLPASLFSGNVNNLTMNGAGGVTLGSATTVAGALTLTSGDLITSSTNTLTLTSAASISGGSSSSFIEGPLDRTLANGSNFSYPIGGNSTNYRPINLNSVVATGNPVVRVTVAESGATTADGTTLSSLLNARNWRVEQISGTFTSATLVITESGMTDGTHEIGKSNNNQAGTYVSLGSQTVSAGAITSPAGQGVGFYAIGVKVSCTNPTAGGTIAANQTICSGGDPAAFTSSAAASGNVGTLEYKWQYSSTSNFSSDVNDIASTNSATYDAPSGLTATTYYRRLARVSCRPANDWTGAAASNILTVTVTTPPNAGTLSGTQAICSTGSTTFTSNGDAGSWSSGSTGVATIDASTGVITPVSAGTSTITYTVTGTGGCSNATATRTVTVTAAPNTGTLSGTQAICSTGSTTFTSNGDAGGSWSSDDVAVATVNSSTGVVTGVAAGTATITYTVTGTGGCSNATGTRTVTVSPTSVGGTATVTASPICSGNSTTVSVSGQTGTIQWQQSADGSTGWATVSGGSGGTTDTYTTPNLSSTTYYRAVVTSGSCTASNSTAATVTVNPTGTWIGGSTGEWNVAGNWCGGVPDQNTEVATIPSGVTVTVNTSPTILTYTLASGSTVNLGNNTITIANGGSFTNNGTFNAGTGSGTVAFAGAGTLDGSAATTFNNLTVSGALTVNTSPTVNGTLTLNNGGSITTNPIIYGASATLVYNQGGSITSGLNEWPTSNPPRNVTIQNASNVTLNGARTINGVLTLTSGDLIIGSNNLTLGSAATVSSASAGSHIVATSTGEMRKIYGNSSFTFPVGDGSNYTPATVNFTTAGSFNGETNDYLGVRLKTSKVTNMNSNNSNYIDRSWFIEPHNSASGFTYTVNLTYVQADVRGTESEIRPVKLSSGVWQYPGNVSFADGTQLTSTTGEINASSDVLSWSGLTSFSEFGGGGQGGPLPVELLYFSADCQDKRVTLNWSTASEKNSSHFDIEKSKDGYDWRVINTLPSAGNSNEKIDYYYEDVDATTGAYYRLNQVDIDGKNKIYGPIKADCELEKDLFYSFPNPSGQGGFSVLLNAKELIGHGNLNISNANGTSVYQKSVEIEKGVSLWNITEPNLAPGVYFIKVANENNESKIIKHIQN